MAYLEPWRDCSLQNMYGVCVSVAYTLKITTSSCNKPCTLVIFVIPHSNVFSIFGEYGQSARTISAIALAIERTAYNSNNEIE